MESEEAEEEVPAVRWGPRDAGGRGCTALNRSSPLRAGRRAILTGRALL